MKTRIEQAYKPRAIGKKRGQGAKKTRKTIKDTGPKIWTLKRADKAFSTMIRNRDGKCMHPIGCEVRDIKKLQCSHFIGRSRKSTRFDPDNCITLCWLHHYKDKMLGYEYQKQTREKHGFDGQYTLFMKRWLGEERYHALQQRSEQSIKQKLSITNCMTLCEQFKS